MNKTNRKIGTFTFGFSLILFGVVFLLKLFLNTITYGFIFKFWPLILVILGLEVLVSYFKNNTDKIHYDAVSLVLICLISVFTMGMAVADFLITNFNQYVLY